MDLRTIATKNLIRRKGKMGLIVFGLVTAVATLVSVVSILQAFQGTVDKKLDEYGFNIVIFPKSKEMLIEYGGLTIGSVTSYRAPALRQDDVDRLTAGSGIRQSIRSLSPKLLDVVDVKGKRVLFAGVDFRTEKRIKKWWLVENGRYPVDRSEVFVGQGAADKLRLAPGDDIVVYGRKLTVAGILMETGSQDDQLIFVGLNELRDLAGKPGQVSLIEVAAKRSEDVDGLVKAMVRALPGANVQSVKQAVQYKSGAMDYLARFGFGVTAIVTLISALIVFTMMASAVNERRAEIGIFRAIGFRQRKIAVIILLEALILGVVSGVVGYLLGFGLAQFLPVFAKGSVAPIALNPLLALFGLAMSITIGLAASLIPARRAANLDPAEALKSL